MSASEKTAEDVLRSEGSLTICGITPVARETRAGVEARSTGLHGSTFVFPDDLTPEVSSEGNATVILPEKSKEVKAAWSSADLSIQKNENSSNPLDEMTVLDFEIREDGSQRTITFRSILIGILVSILGASIEEVFVFKPIHIQVHTLFLQLVAFILGNLFASIPGPHWWNPGTLETKEVVFSVIMAASASAGVVGVELIATQDVIFHKKMPAIISIMTLLSSQLIGYGIAGLLRPILVYPAQITYPAVLPIVALFQSMSSQSETTVKQLSFFKKLIVAISLYEIIPTYLAPALQAISVWCLTLPKVPAITNLFGGSLPGEGIGLMAFSADWTLVGSLSPLYVPLLAQMTEWLAFFVCIIIYSAAYTGNWFNGGHLPFISFTMFDKEGNPYNLTALVKKDGTGDAEVINRFGPPFFPTSMVLAFSFLCMASAASITIGGYTSIVSALENKKQMRLHGKIARPCPHREITKKMREFPAYSYVIILLGAIAMAFLASHLADSGLSPGGLATSLVTSFVLALAAGYFYGTIGLQLLTGPVTQLLGGIFFPGNASGLLWFTMYGSTSVQQCVLMLNDLKLGTYMHLAPFSVVMAQLIGTLTGGVVHTLVMMSIVNSQRDVLLMPRGNGIFSGTSLSVMATQATAWGLFSRAIFFPGKIYAIMLYALIIGFFVPVPFFIFNRFFPNSVLAKVNASVFIAGLAHVVVGANSGRFTALVVGFISQFYLRKYHFKWYKKYNYILCAALDGGTQITVVLLAFFFQGGAGFQVKIPTYFLNPQGTRDYCKIFPSTTGS